MPMNFSNQNIFKFYSACTSQFISRQDKDILFKYYGCFQGTDKFVCRLSQSRETQWDDIKG